MMEEAHDIETGEVLDSTSGAAISAMVKRAAADHEMVMGYANGQLYAALMAATKKLPVWITTDKDGAHKIKYATLKAILETVRPVLMEQGIRIRQGAEHSRILDEGGGSKGRLIPVYTDLIHSETGQQDRTIIEIPLTRFDAQAMGSAITYGRRYSLLAALGLATDEADDDGEGAKPRDLTASVKESAELVKFKAEIDACKDATSLYEWGEKVKAKKLADKLSEEEHVLLRKHYGQRLNGIMNAPAEVEKTAKKARE